MRKAPEFWRRGAGGLAAIVLSPFGWCYGVAGHLRRAIINPWRAPVPVLCVGNVVAGGAGKTPVALDLARRLIADGKSVSFLSRGYGGVEKGPYLVSGMPNMAKRVGDEPILLSRIAPTWVAWDRKKGGKEAADNSDVIIMDDGFQNPSLAKSCAILVVDGEYGFGNGYQIPAGPLRESPVSALHRANAVVILGEDSAGVGSFTRSLSPDIPILRAGVVPGDEIKALRKKKITAFAGIGQPEKFFQTLIHNNCNVLSKHPFPDHYSYTSEDIKHLRSLATETDSLLLTTEKDFVRIPLELRDNIEVLTITLHWEDETLLVSLLDQMFQAFH